MRGHMTDELGTFLPAALPIPAAIAYSGFTRTFLYENRKRLVWLKAGKRSLITRASLDALLKTLPRVGGKS